MSRHITVKPRRNGFLFKCSLYLFYYIVKRQRRIYKLQEFAQYKNPHAKSNLQRDFDN
ncbi:MAG: primase C-terminal domain-containing protein [Clostridia bacterium]|nr:primase C-terminal domain-containing protein [Clostridia bacterium]